MMKHKVVPVLDETEISPLPSIELARFFNDSLTCDIADQWIGVFSFLVGKFGDF